MNVTVKLPDDLCRAARHRAVDEDMSLSGWLAGLIEKELNREPRRERTVSLVEALEVPAMPEWFFERPLPLEPRKETPGRSFAFEEESR